MMWAAVACASSGLATTPEAAEALLVIEADSGRVLYAHNAGQPWYPASVTKLMTAYVTLRAVEEGRITLDKPLTVSATAAAQAPVKMGFPPGTVVTVDNALKMMMVKSANDMAAVLAEGVSGSVENFADEMNSHARRLGMIQSSFVNPNGLPAEDQIVSARDMAILARALLRARTVERSSGQTNSPAGGLVPTYTYRFRVTTAEARSLRAMLAAAGLEVDWTMEAAALASNPALLKLDLYCKGARLDDSCYIEGDGGRKVLRTRAGLGSGLELILPGGLWTNVPVTEPFAARSPYEVRRSDAGYVLRYEDAELAPVQLSPRPEWYDARTSSGKPMTRIGTLQGTYLAIYPGRVCDFWVKGPARPERESCRFC